MLAEILRVMCGTPTPRQQHLLAQAAMDHARRQQEFLDQMQSAQPGQVVNVLSQRLHQSQLQNLLHGSNPVAVIADEAEPEAPAELPADAYANVKPGDAF